jgi:hypothetical protein
MSNPPNLREVIQTNHMKLIPLLFFFQFLACSGCNNENEIGENYTNSNCPNPTKLSFEELLDNKDFYNGKLVELVGVFKGHFELSALFSGKNFNKSNGIWIEFSDEDGLINDKSKLSINHDSEAPKIEDKKIRIVGIFDKTEKGHMSEYAGGLKSICLCEVYK